jgi:hypothetical protein
MLPSQQQGNIRAEKTTMQFRRVRPRELPSIFSTSSVRHIKSFQFKRLTVFRYSRIAIRKQE